MGISNQDDLIYNFLVGKDELSVKFEEDAQKINKLAMQHARMNALGIKGKDIQQNYADVLGKTYDYALDRANKKIATFDMRQLSILFFAMQVGRVFSQAFSAIENTYAKVETNTTGLARETLGLSASWEFLKFSIFNALDQPIILGFIDGIISVINWVSDLINRFPAIGIGLIVAFGVLAVGGSIMSFIVSFNMFWAQTFGVGGVLATTTEAGLGTATTGAAGAGTVAGSFSKLMTKTLPTIIGAGLAIYAFIRTVKGMGETEETPMDSILYTAIIGGVGVGLLTWNPVAGVLAGGVILITLLLSNESKKTIKAIDDIMSTPNYNRTPEDAYFTGWQGTVVPQQAQFQNQNVLPDNMVQDLQQKQLDVLKEIAGSLNKQPTYYGNGTSSAFPTG